MNSNLKLSMEPATNQLAEVTPEIAALNRQTFVIRDEIRSATSTLILIQQDNAFNLIASLRDINTSLLSVTTAITECTNYLVSLSESRK